jgi:hypothetical protein
MKIEVSPDVYVVDMKTEGPLERHRELYHKNKLKSETKPPKRPRSEDHICGGAPAKRVVDVGQAAQVSNARPLEAENLE